MYATEIRLYFNVSHGTRSIKRESRHKKFQLKTSTEEEEKVLINTLGTYLLPYRKLGLDSNRLNSPSYRNRMCVIRPSSVTESCVGKFWKDPSSSK